MEPFSELARLNRFAAYNHIEPESTDKDTATFRLDVQEESLNPYGYVHGGALYTMADCAAGYAAHSDGRHYVTQNSTVHFLSNQTGGTLLAKAKVRHRGHITCIVDVDITGEDGKCLMTGTYTFFCIGE